MYTYQQYSHKAGHIGRIATMRRPTSQQTPRSASVDLGAIPMNTGGGNLTTNSPQNWTVQKDEKYLDSQNKKQTIDIEQIFIQKTAKGLLWTKRKISRFFVILLHILTEVI